MLSRQDWWKLAPLLVVIAAYGAFADELPGDGWLWTISLMTAAIVTALIVARGSRHAG